MANGGHTTDTRNWDRAHSDIEVVKSRVTGIENSLTGVQASLQNLADRLATKPTDVWKVVGGVVGLLGLIGAFLYQGKAYIDSTLERHDREIGRFAETALTKEDFKTAIDLQQRRNIEADTARAKLKDEIDSARIDIARMDGTATERQVDYLRDHALLDAHIGSVDANQIKRPEIESALLALREMTTLTNSAINNRFDTLVGSVNELRRDFGSSWTASDTLRELQTTVRDMQNRIGGWQPAPPIPPAPPK